jgi:signal transduction histidine kinase
MLILGGLGKLRKNQNNSASREYYLKQDITQSRRVSLLLILPFVGFVVNDYLFLGFSYLFYFLVAVRIASVLVVILIWVKLGMANSCRAYDKVMFWGLLASIICGGIINISRPDNFVLHSIITLVSVFGIYLVFPLRYSHQVFLASFMTIGEALIILLLANNGQIQVGYTLLTSMLIANVVAGVCSWQVHSHRSAAFDEFNHRKALQESLEQQSNQLSILVAEKTNELVEAQSRLVRAERFAAIGQLAGMVSHDLRNPLAGIKNAVYLLKKKQTQLDNSGSCMLDTIDQAVEHADNIITDLLEYSREVHLQLEDHSSKTLVSYVLLSVQIPSNIRIIQKVDSQQLRVDASKVQRVFVNLVKNAVEAMPNGGKLEITTLKTKNSFDFIFSDSGVGMSEEVVAKIFTPLFTTKAQGMGLGLVICKRLVEAHNGTISVESFAGRGTMFTVSLPLSKSA